MLGGKEAWENVDSTEGKYLPLFCLKFLIMCSDFLHMGSPSEDCSW